MVHQGWHLAQMNVGTTVAPLDDPALADFMANLDRINALAEQAHGFVWRLQSDSGNATDIPIAAAPARFIVNMSVWDSVPSLFEFVYRTAHREFMVRRREWFERPEGAYQVLWWTPAGTLPSVTEGLDRLARLEREGPGPLAFGFRSVHPPPGLPGSAEDHRPDPYCVGWR